ncbi:hypothetical protein D3H55_13485 [Bacillus salacetis]|uniref:Uncharacterized protein n=1 Tax=Bacillus salacetis TaxID=2315464 RepID=A0A3A1QVC6_9BACI|nr:hypothetical protein [Bacillus salacetis]RIW32283.1 hypothetical protein D3H55_13485 [Bacillus salacetis]
MLEHQVEDLFDFYGYSDLYRRFRYPLFVSGLLDKASTEELEDFFENFSFHDRQPLFDEFRYWFQYFLVTRKSFT